MALKNHKKFLEDSESVAFDLIHRSTLRYNISKYNTAVKIGESRYKNIELAKDRAAEIKRFVVANLSHYLQQFESSAVKNGIEVLWAVDSNEAVEHIEKIIKSTGAKKIVKSKSMTSEEINFNEVFEKMGIISQETDLGEFIVQKSGEKPYHIVTPAMHKSRSDIAKLFHTLYDTSVDATASEMTSYVKNILRSDFETADIGLTGANFLMAKEGAVGLTENEGNGLFSVSYPKIHVVLAGIEKLLPSMEYLNLFWPLLAQHGTGQQVTVYNSLIFGPKKKKENDGPERMIVILMDNGRSNLYSKSAQSEALSCIRCGACLNACPIYKNIGGHAYNSVYSGPIGAVIVPHLKDFDEYKHLSFASSLCGLCYEVCPVKIDLPQLLLLNRRDAVENGKQSMSEKLLMISAYKLLNSPFLMDLSHHRIKNILMKYVGNSYFGSMRLAPTITQDSFRKQWKNRYKN